MNREKFHNELALRLGYERIVTDKKILISVEESDERLVTLKIDGSEDVLFKASEKPDDYLSSVELEIRDEIKIIGEVVHVAYMKSISETLACYNEQR